MDLSAIERGWRVLWMRAIGRLLPGGRTTALPRATAERPLRVLFVRYERIGDLIMATGMIRVLAQSSPHVTVDVVANPVTRPVLDHNPHVGRVFVLDRRQRGSYLSLGRALRRERYDVIVDGRINNPPVFTSTPILMLLARAPYRVGVGGGNNDLVYNVRVAEYDRSTHYVRGSMALAVPFGVDPARVDWRPEIVLTDDERARAAEVWARAGALAAGGAAPAQRLLVNLSASEPKRRWSDDHFATVLEAVRAAHPHLLTVVIGLPAEWERVQQVASRARAEPAATPALRDALALVGTSDMVFTPDTSISHAASAFALPAVVLLKRNHHPYAPWETPGELVFWDGDTIEGLAVAPVRDAVLRLVAGAEPPGSPEGVP